MPLHDEYARLTPFEIAFPDLEEAEPSFQQVVEEAEARGVPPGDLSRFIMLGSVAALVKSLRGPEGPTEVAHEYAALAFHAFHFAGAGHRIDLVSTAVARQLAGDSLVWAPPAVSGEVSPATPGSAALHEPGQEVPSGRGQAGYVQFPQHLFWMDVSPGDPPQSVDGFFWTLGANGVLYVLLALGLSGDRGMVVVPLPEAPWADRADWLHQAMREDGADFASSLPGAELDDLYAFESAGEVLKLLARLFAHLDEMPATAMGVHPSGSSPPASKFSSFRVEFDG